MIKAAGGAPLLFIMQIRKKNHPMYPGLRFDKLTVIEEIYKPSKDRKSKRYIKCICDCGRIVIKQPSHLFAPCNILKSCGCVKRVYNNAKGEHSGRFKHGLSNSIIYNTWAGMISRVSHSNRSDYHNYGGRGITICTEWKTDFRVFYKWAMANGYKVGLEIDRIDVNGNYEPSNCRWVTNWVNSLNRRKKPNYGLMITKNGKWRVQIGRNNKRIYLGRFANRIDAIEARDLFIKNWNQENNIQL
jgi:hypothetical protein